MRVIRTANLRFLRWQQWLPPLPLFVREISSAHASGLPSIEHSPNLQTHPRLAHIALQPRVLLEVSAHPFDLLLAETPTAWIGPRLRRDGASCRTGVRPRQIAPWRHRSAQGARRAHRRGPISSTAIGFLTCRPATRPWKRSVALRRHQPRLTGRQETPPLQRHAHRLIWRVATSFEHLCDLLRSVSDEARQTVRRFITAAEALAGCCPFAASPPTPQLLSFRSISTCSRTRRRTPRSSRLNPGQFVSRASQKFC